MEISETALWMVLAAVATVIIALVTALFWVLRRLSRHKSDTYRFNTIAGGMVFVLGTAALVAYALIAEPVFTLTVGNLVLGLGLLVALAAVVFYNKR